MSLARIGRVTTEECLLVERPLDVVDLDVVVVVLDLVLVVVLDVVIVVVVVNLVVVVEVECSRMKWQLLFIETFHEE